MKYLILAIMILLLNACTHKTLPAQKRTATCPQKHQTLPEPEPLIFPEILYNQPPYQPANPDTIHGKLGNKIYIRIFKAEKILELWMQVGKRYKLLNTYPILKTSGELGPKTYEGDRQNPEGVYFVTLQKLNRFSKYHLAINIGYPNKLDKSLGRTGSAIMIHGNKKSIGCFAMGDEAIEDIYPLVYTALDLGQHYCKVAIYPFIMNDKNMQDYALHPWYPFWEELKVDYDIFEAEHYPADVRMQEGSYIFKSALK